MNNTALNGISKIVGFDSLERWLRVIKQESGQQLAARAAMRVLPIGWDWLISSTGTEVTQPLLTCAFYATNPPNAPSKKLPQNVQTALFYNADYSARASATKNGGPAAVLAAANSAAAATTLPLSHSTRSASNAALSAASAFGVEMTKTDSPGSMTSVREGFWAEIRADCTKMCENTDLRKHPLWALQAAPFDDHWHRIKQALQGQPEWESWLLWYEALLTGTTFSLDLLAEG